MKRYCACCGKIFEIGKSDRRLCRSCNGLVKYIATAFEKADFLPVGIQGYLFRTITMGRPLWCDDESTKEEFRCYAAEDDVWFYKTLDNKSRHIDCSMPMQYLLRLKNFKREDLRFMKSENTFGFEDKASETRFVIGAKVESEVRLGDIV